MNTSFQHGSAKIYQFPQRGTMTADGRRIGRGPDLRPDTRHIPAVAICTGSWYHEAAVQDADRARKP